jgi:hypothetical protein
MRPPLLLVVLAAVAVVGPRLRSQQVPEPSRLGQAFAGVHAESDGIFAFGPAYKARATLAGVEFTPALGAAAAVNQPLLLRLGTIGRGEARQPVGEAQPVATGDRITYERVGCVERYDVRPEGLHQSFLFERLPAGEGDLVVRLDVSTPLLAETTPDGGLRFVLPGVGGVALSAVTGIDARGRTVPGSMVLDGARLELRLPAAFVDTAALPLVLDPLLTTFTVAGTGSDEEDPEIATSTSNSMVVWQLVFSASDRDLRAQVFSYDGSLVGPGVMALTSGVGDDRHPSLGYVAERQRWVIVFERAGDLVAVSATSQGAVSPEVVVAGGADVQIEPDVAGETAAGFADAICVFRNQTQGKLQAMRIRCNSSGTLMPVATVDLVTSQFGSSLGRPRIAHRGGDVGRYLVVYPRTTLLTSLTSVRGLVLTRFLGVLGSAVLTNSGADDDNPEVDGDGVEWVVVHDSDPSVGAGNRDVRALPVRFDAASGTVLPGSSVAVANTANDEFEPVVACLHTVAVVAWRHRVSAGSTNTDWRLATVDRFGCRPCEQVLSAASTSAIERNFAIDGGRINVSPNGINGVVLVFESSNALTESGNIQAVAYLADDGLRPIGGVTGPSCGGGGEADFVCARQGNSNFHLRLRGARPATGAWVVIGPQFEWYQVHCGPCMLAVDPYEGLVDYVGVTDGVGDLALQVAIPASPAIVGLGASAQWLVVHGGGLCTFVPTDFSSVVRFIIQ